MNHVRTRHSFPVPGLQFFSSCPPSHFIALFNLEISLYTRVESTKEDQPRLNNKRALGSIRAKAKVLTFVRLVDLVHAVAAEAGKYPPGADNRHGKRAWYFTRRLELPACICGEIAEKISKSDGCDMATAHFSVI